MTAWRPRDVAAYAAIAFTIAWFLTPPLVRFATARRYERVRYEKPVPQDAIDVILPDVFIREDGKPEPHTDEFAFDLGKPVRCGAHLRLKGALVTKDGAFSALCLAELYQPDQRRIPRFSQIAITAINAAKGSVHEFVLDLTVPPTPGNYRFELMVSAMRQKRVLVLEAQNVRVDCPQSAASMP